MVGAVVDNAGPTVIFRALVVMGLCWPIGLFLGSVAQRTIQENIETYKQEHPIPEKSKDETDAEEEQTEAEPGAETDEDPTALESTRSAA